MLRTVKLKSPTSPDNNTAAIKNKVAHISTNSPVNHLDCCTTADTAIDMGGISKKSDYPYGIIGF